MTDAEIDVATQIIDAAWEGSNDLWRRAIFRAGMREAARIAYGNSTGSAQCERIVLAIRAAAGEGEG